MLYLTMKNTKMPKRQHVPKNLQHSFQKGGKNQRRRFETVPKISPFNVRVCPLSLSLHQKTEMSQDQSIFGGVAATAKKS